METVVKWFNVIHLHMAIFYASTNSDAATAATCNEDDEPDYACSRRRSNRLAIGICLANPIITTELAGHVFAQLILRIVVTVVAIVIARSNDYD
jgi:hypothetical protein